MTEEQKQRVENVRQFLEKEARECRTERELRQQMCFAAAMLKDAMKEPK